jgi:type IV secretion system protein VirB9
MTFEVVFAALALSAAPPPAAKPAKALSPPLAYVAKANRAATQQPAPSFFVNAAQVYAWRDGAIYQVYTTPGAVTDIALQPGEVLVSVAAGDTTRWVIGDTTSGSGETKRTHVLVKPIAAGLATNLVITTDRRVYLINLSANASTAMAAISWTYPADALLAVRPAPQVAPSASAVPEPDLERLNFNYRVTGDRPAWRPWRAFDDGRHTYIEFPASIASGEAPPLFVVGEDGATELVNYRVRGRFYVVDRIFDTAELRLGTKKSQRVRIERTSAPVPRAEGRR